MVATSALQHAAPALLVLSTMLAAGNWYLQPDRAGAWASTVFLIGGMTLALLFAPRNKDDAARRRRSTGCVRRGARRHDPTGTRTVLGMGGE